MDIFHTCTRIAALGIHGGLRLRAILPRAGPLPLHPVPRGQLWLASPRPHVLRLQRHRDHRLLDRCAFSHRLHVTQSAAIRNQTAEYEAGEGVEGVGPKNGHGVSGRARDARQTPGSAPPAPWTFLRSVSMSLPLACGCGLRLSLFIRILKRATGALDIFSICFDAPIPLAYGCGLRLSSFILILELQSYTGTHSSTVVCSIDHVIRS